MRPSYCFSILGCAMPTCSFVFKFVSQSDISPEIVLAHVKRPAMLRHEPSVIVLMGLVRMHA